MLCTFLFLFTSSSLFGAELDEAQKLFLSGQYESCAKLARQSAEDHARNEDWPILLSRCLLTLGEYAEAQNTISNALVRNPGGIRIRLEAREVFLQNGQTQRAKEVMEEINQLGGTRRWAYRDPLSVVALGKAALLLGADPKKVLDNFLNPAKKSDATQRETYLAIGQLALDKYDYELAAKTFQEATERFPKDPDMLCGLAKAYSSGDRPQMIEAIETALGENPRHTPSLLLLADHMIDAEEYPKADETLGKVLAVNATHPEAWAYRAVLAHLRSDPAQEEKSHQAALSHWRTNPRVDYLIGQKLSQKYRFAEGSVYQRQAIRSDADYLPARIQLAQDLLRLGEEEEGWPLAEEVHNHDGYDIVAYNLATLHETVSRFQLLTNESFKVRMHPHEAAVYGDRATNLLERARATLSKKYGFEPPGQTTVEIFPEQKDFAVRTFMMPGGEGFLGVCFGNVITANSPAAHAASVMNWEAVLWHEFCHVITLGLTKNKMPRWLSEGISVYEEKQANPAWGQRMNRHYREMILKGDLTTVGNLSAAFLAPKTAMHLQFAYYESSLVVEFLVERFGLASLRAVLTDLAEGKSINQAIQDRTAPLKTIEKDFAAFAKQRAEQLAPGLDWKEPKPDELAKNEEKWIEKHPKNFWALTQQAKKLLADKKWTEAKVPAQKLLELYPDCTGGDSPYALLAAAHRGLNETDLEREMLSKLASLDGEAADAYVRLMELGSAAKDWTLVTTNAERFAAVNPLTPQPHRYLARASEELGRSQDAIHSYRTLLLLDPADPADVHFHLAKLLRAQGDPAAKRHLLQALEEAPRFREAHRILLEMSGQSPPTGESRATSAPQAQP